MRWFGTAVDIHDLYAASESRDLLAKELSHRIKNIFAVVSRPGLAVGAQSSPEVKDFGEELIGTIQALGRAHDYVRPAEGKRRTALHGMLDRPVRALRQPRPGRASPVHGDDVTHLRRAPPRRWRWCSTSWRPTRPSTARFRPTTATVDLSIDDQGKTLLLRWVERGGPPPEAQSQGRLRLAAGRDERDRPARRLVGAPLREGRDGLRADRLERPRSRLRPRPRRGLAHQPRTPAAPRRPRPRSSSPGTSGAPVRSTSSCATHGVRPPKIAVARV